jgi:hypothetical protein
MLSRTLARNYDYLHVDMLARNLNRTYFSIQAYTLALTLS